MPKIAVARIVIRQACRHGLSHGMGGLPHVLAQIARQAAVIEFVPVSYTHLVPFETAVNRFIDVYGKQIDISQS